MFGIKNDICLIFGVRLEERGGVGGGGRALLAFSTACDGEGGKRSETVVGKKLVSILSDFGVRIE